MTCKEKPTREEADIARAQAFKVAQKQFRSLIKDQITAQEITISKTQPEDAIAIDIKEEALDKILQQLINMELVSTIDATGSLITEQPHNTDMGRFLK